jgi:hypothetical protein
MTFYHLMGIISTIALIVPIILTLIFRLPKYRSFPALLAYYIILLGYNIMHTGLFKPDESLSMYYAITSNLAGTPLILLFLTHFTTTAANKKRLYILSACYLFYEIIMIAVFGYTLEASVIAMGPGLILLVSFSLVLFVRNTKFTIVYQYKALGKALVSTALLFAHLGYSFIYIFLYLMKTPHQNDTYLIYFFINTLSSVFMSVGIYFEAQRIKDLEELKTTREELRKLYGEDAETKTATSVETTVFKFDNNKHWN